MPYWTEMTAVCPQCGAIATGRKEINDVFGFRYGGTVPQSWCKACRNDSSYSSSKRCDYGDCIWADEYPRCKEEEKCPWL